MQSKDLIRGFMGQVPIHRYLLIGSGALARHLYFYLSSSKNSATEITTWNRKDNSFANLNTKLSSCTHILLAISDSALSDFYLSYHSLTASHARWIHFSGAHNFENLIAAHPLMSFGPEIYDLEVYRKIHFALTGVNALKEIFPFLENSYSILSVDKKSLYHSLCVLGGNMPILLWEKMNAELSKMNIPTAATDVYLEIILQNYLKYRDKALTGPLKRKDLTTIKNNLSALENDHYQKIYSAFAESQNINTRDL